jgi:hypothetical protein
MSGLQWWQGLGGAASVLVGAQNEKEKFDAAGAAIGGGIAMFAIVFIIIIILNILFVFLAYKMFPDYKGIHAFMTFVLGFFWLIPAVIYYLFILEGYHMKGIRITKRG